MDARGNWKWAIILATAAAVGMYGAAAKVAQAHGGEHEHHAAEHHEGEHHAEHHEHHEEHHAEHHHEHHDDHHWNHHHHDWHYAGWGWGPGFVAGAATGYGLGNWGGWGAGYAGGDAIIENPSDNSESSSEMADNLETPTDAVADGSVESNAKTTAANGPKRLPVDNWPELGISTFSGHNGDQRGLVVVKVKEGSVADKAGLVAGDVILNLDGQPTPDDEALETLLETAKGEFKLQVCDAQSGEKRTLSGNLGAAEPAGLKTES
jgi:PDZ domain